MDLFIRSNQIITENNCLDGTIAVKDGKIVGLYGPEVTINAKKVIDARGKVVLPGAIDPHAHIRFPASPEREDLISGTTSAAAGGFTTIFEMPVTSPGVRTAEILRERMKMAREKSVIDIALYAGGGHGASEHFLEMAEVGAVAYKIILHRIPHGRDNEFFGICQNDDGELLSDLYKLKEANRVVVIHAECDSILEYAQKQVERDGLIDRSAHARTHPLIAELASISRLILFAQTTGTPISIAHVSSPQSAQMIKEAKQRGVKIYACLLYTSPSPRDGATSRMPSSA